MSSTSTSTSTGKMPVLFAGHGSPMNALDAESPFSQTFTTLGQQLPTPKALLVVSAHWFVNGTSLTAEATPKTLHDFGGFPRALYEMQYPAPGAPDLARQVQRMLSASTTDASRTVGLSTEWGLDHGTWTVLKWMVPNADVPVVQLSLDRRLSAAQHVALATSLRDLRHQGVIVVGSGNVTHNLRDAITRMRSGTAETPAWAQRFDDDVKRATVQHDLPALQRMLDGDDGRQAHPSPDHWWPYLYAAALTDADDDVSFSSEVFDAGSLSMRNTRWG